MKNKLILAPALLWLSFVSTQPALATTCDNFTMNGSAGSTGAITCTFGSGNITLENNIVKQIDGATKSTLFTGVIDISANLHGLTNNAPVNSGFGAFSVDSSVWDNWGSIYVGLKQGNEFGLFKLTNAIDAGTWSTAPGLGTGLSHYIAFGGTPSAVPVPAAVWLFGSAMFGLVVTRRKQS